VYYFLFISLQGIFIAETNLFSTILDETATLFASEKILIGLDSFKEIANQGPTIIDKILLIAKFIEYNMIVSLIIRP